MVETWTLHAPPQLDALAGRDEKSGQPFPATAARRIRGSFGTSFLKRPPPLDALMVETSV
jgi:hypothetical protein